MSDCEICNPVTASPVSVEINGWLTIEADRTDLELERVDHWVWSEKRSMFLSLKVGKSDMSLYVNDVYTQEEDGVMSVRCVCPDLPMSITFGGQS